MTKIEVLKELLRKNFNETIKLINDGLSIDFKCDEFIVVDKDKNVIFKNKILNYDVDYNGQEKFILDVASKITLFVEVSDSIDYILYNTVLKEINKRYCIDILGSGYIRKNAKFIEVNPEIKFLDYDEYNYLMDDAISMIKNSLDEDKIRVVLYSDRYQDGFYVDGAVKESDTYIYYIDDEDKDFKGIEFIDDINNYIDEYYTFIYYINTTKKEIEEAVEFIKELVA